MHISATHGEADPAPVVPTIDQSVGHSDLGCTRTIWNGRRSWASFAHSAPSLAMAEFISNSAILTTTRASAVLVAEFRTRSTARYLAEFAVKSATVAEDRRAGHGLQVAGGDR